jgi:hypothetical protein
VAAQPRSEVEPSSQFQAVLILTATIRFALQARDFTRLQPDRSIWPEGVGVWVYLVDTISEPGGLPTESVPVLRIAVEH